MQNRFKHSAKVDRHRIRPAVRLEVYSRDEHRCQYCGVVFPEQLLTIDHLVPLALGGVDEVINYVTACSSCNQRKAAQPLATFAATVNVRLEDLPVHGDSVIDNTALPIEIRLVRKRVFDRMRSGELAGGGRALQKRVEKEYRRDFWATPSGKQLEAAFPSLPGHVRIMVPEIQAIAESEREFQLLVELAKSASTRNLIGTVLNAGVSVESVVRKLATSHPDAALARRLQQALSRFDKTFRSGKLPSARY
jgi:hypothetical protein